MICADCVKYIQPYEPHYPREDGFNIEGHRVYTTQCSACNYIEEHG